LAPSALCLGIGGIGVKNTEKEGHAILDAFVEKGGNFIDTARVYSDWVPGEKSRSERILGDWLSARRNRSKMIIATKGAHPDLSTMHIPRMSRQEVSGDLNGSLKTLRIDFIDLYWLHRDDPQRPVEEILDMLEGFSSEGKIRYYGCSNWTARRIREAIKYARQKGYNGFVANQMLWNVGCYNMVELKDKTLVKFDKDTFDLHKESGMAAVPYSSQANGFFSKIDAADAASREKAEKSDYNTEKNRTLQQHIKRIARDHSLTIAEVVLVYLLSQPITTIPIIGCRSLDQLDESLKAVESNLPKEAILELEKLTGSGLAG
jgi:aryl-alcohol dehydrogenase-like predicted oxidoreductase